MSPPEDPGSAAARITVTTELPWLVRGWCRLLTRPRLRLDGVDHALAWGSPRASATVTVPPGEHRAQFRVCYRGTRDLGAGSRILLCRLEHGQTLSLLARVPAVNGHPPTLQERTG